MNYNDCSLFLSPSLSLFIVHMVVTSNTIHVIRGFLLGVGKKGVTKWSLETEDVIKNQDVCKDYVTFGHS